MRFPKHDMFGLMMSKSTKSPKMISMAYVPKLMATAFSPAFGVSAHRLRAHYIPRPTDKSTRPRQAKRQRLGRKQAENFYAGLTVCFAGSADIIGFFLELRNLGFFVLFSEREAQEKHGAEREERQHEFEETFHSNLPSSFLSKTEKMSICFFKVSSIY
jgi:hypothetical protein